MVSSTFVSKTPRRFCLWDGRDIPEQVERPEGDDGTDLDLPKLYRRATKDVI